MNIYTIFLVFTVLIGTVQAAGKRKNLFELGIDERVGRLTAIFNPAIRALEICKQNLKENPDVSDFKSNFDLINCAYQKIYTSIVSDQELILEFITLQNSHEVKEKIEIIKQLFEEFYLLIAHNNPLCSLIDNVEQEKKELQLTIKKFLDHKQFHDALVHGKKEVLNSLLDQKQEASDEVEIVIEPDIADDEKHAQQLQLELNLELMHEREAQEQRVLDNYRTNKNLVNEQAVKQVECFSAQEVVSECYSARRKRTSIFSKATNDARFIRELKKIIYGVDVTDCLDQELFDRLTAQAPTNFSMLMNREIGRATSHDIMKHDFSEPRMTSYAHYFPECLILDLESRVITLEGHSNAVFYCRQLEDGRLVSCSRHGIIKLWDLKIHECVATLQQDDNPIFYIEEFDNGFIACYSCFDDTIRARVWVWDLNNCKCIGIYYDRCVGAYFVTARLNDGHRVSGAFDSEVKIFTPNLDQCIGSCEHEGSIRCIQQLSDGRLASCSDDKTIKIWDLYPSFSLEQIALVVHLERYRRQDKVVNLGGGWSNVFETLPSYFQKRFELSVSFYSI